MLDARRRPVPIGVPGELYIGGDGLARGYLRRPELTAERFVPDPFARGAGALYRTGDRVRWRADGAIEFLGRLDDQVKIRGFRIEPGEIEAALARHLPAVREAVVMAREDAPGERRLVAYVVRRDGKPRARPSCARSPATRLPEYMVPSAFVVLDALPLTPNGKVDRARAAGARGTDPPQRRRRFVRAADSDSRPLIADLGRACWAVERVGVQDNFFELGGHSLLATHVISRVRDSLRLEVSLRKLFEFPTISKFAEALSGVAIPDGDVLDERLAWWKTRLVDAPRVELPPDRRRPTSRHSQPGRCRRALGAALSEMLELEARREGGALEVTLLTAFLILLFRQTGQQDVAVRSGASFALRADLGGDPTVPRAGRTRAGRVAGGTGARNSGEPAVGSAAGVDFTDLVRSGPRDGVRLRRNGEATQRRSRSRGRPGVRGNHAERRLRRRPLRRDANR